MIEISDVVLELEQPKSEAGDLLAKTYTQAIDLLTAPQPLSEADTELLASSLRRLNRNLATTSFYLSGSVATEAYDSVVDQLNGINDANPSFEQLRPLMSREESRGLWSPRFKFHDSSLS